MSTCADVAYVSGGSPFRGIVIEAFVAIGVGLIAGSTALIAFGVDSLIEVISAVVLLWRLLHDRPERNR